LHQPRRPRRPPCPHERGPPSRRARRTAAGGREANVDAWRGYFSSFPEYVVYARHITADGSRVSVLGATTGSHLGLSDEEELQLGVIWLADVAGGVLSSWQVVEDSPEARRRYGVLAGSSTST
jgi:hypothetical protein